MRAVDAGLVVGGTMFRSRAFWTILLLLTLVNPSSASAACPWGELAGKAIRFFTRQTTPSENGVPKEWHQDRTPERRLQVELAKGKNLDNTSIPELFLAQAKRDPDRVLLIDESRGPLTNRDIVAGVYFLKDRIAGLGPEENLGMMLPASAGATVATLATQFAGKTPTMLNFTAGNKNISSAIQTAGVKKILTSRVFMEDLLKRSPDLKAYESMFVYLEDMREAPGAKLELAKAMLKSRLGAWHDLEKIKPAKYSVILFTSGSSGSPKAVPLTHANQIANIQSILQAVPLHEKDRIIGVLPPFHSFGATGNVVLPLITGAKMAFYPNPLSGKGVAEAVEKYEGTVVLGTPTFLQLMARGAKDGQLSTLRIGISGAERMTEKAAHAIAEKLPPGFVVLEAYGTTEAAPAVTMNRLDNPIAGSIGERLPGV